MKNLSNRKSLLEEILRVSLGDRLLDFLNISGEKKEIGSLSLNFKTSKFLGRRLFVSFMPAKLTEQVFCIAGRSK